MCNARNHPPGCTCGWGGDGHLGRRVSSGYVAYYGRDMFEVIADNKEKYAQFESFVDPNATCPVCGEPVYYYESPYGGKVYFDALGPPWPKHPCTDNEYQTIGSGKKQYLSWKDDGWKPFFLEAFKDYNKDFFVFSGYLLENKEKMRGYVRKSQMYGVTFNFHDNPSHIKFLPDKKILFSTFSERSGFIDPIQVEGSLTAPFVVVRRGTI